MHLKARDLSASLLSMRTAVTKIPGGHLDLAKIDELNAMLDLEAGKRR